MSTFSDEEILNSLGYNINNAVSTQFKKIRENTKDFEKIQKHILDLNENLKHMSSHISMSNSKDYLKIKHDGSSAEILKEFHERLDLWSKKYKVEIQKVPQKETYYIIGYKH